MNIYDIAEKCGVSIATVSRVLNGSPSVSEKTRQRVQAVMEQEGYAPSSMARGLGTGYTRMVGLLYTDPESPLTMTAIRCAEAALRSQGMSLLLRSAGNQPEDTKRALDELAGQGVDGLLVVGNMSFAGESAAALTAAATRAPLVMVGSALSIPGAYSVTCDEKQAIAETVVALFSRQRRNILLLYSDETPGVAEKIAGYWEGHAASGSAVSEERIVQTKRMPDAVNACIKQLLVRGVSFDAVIGTEDVLAIGAQKALQRIGLTMPVIGCNNSLLARCATPELTSIDNRPEELCVAAVDILCRRLRGEEASVSTVLPARLMERDTFRRN